MNILIRYITKTIIFSTGMVFAIVFAILSVMLLLGELKNIGQGDYTIIQVFIYVLFKLPIQIYSFSPLIILLGSIVGLSMLSSHCEMIVMRASGFSKTRIIIGVMEAAFIMIVIFILLGELFAPHLSYKAEIHKENARNAGQAVLTNAGIWFHVGNNFIHAEEVVNRKLLRQLTRYEFDQNYQLKTAYFAKTLRYDEQGWTMHDGLMTTFYPDQTVSEAYIQRKLDLMLNPDLLSIGLFEASDMSLNKLYQFAMYLKRNQLQASQYLFNFWQRLFQPLVSIMMVLLAVPFVLGASNRTTIGWRIIVGAIVGFGFYVLNNILSELSIVYQLPPLLAATLPLFIFSILLGFLFYLRR